MYETVRTVNGFNVIRMKGTHGVYHVYVKPNMFYSFKTIKSAVAFCETL